MTSPGRPPPTAGLRHVALFARNFEASVRFYTDVMGMRVEWRPDADNCYLTNGNDNLALHRSTREPTEAQRLDHIGFIIERIEDVDAWHAFLLAEKVEITNPPKTHRDGARSLYCRDPEGTSVQLIYHPPLSRRDETLGPQPQIVESE